MEKNKVNFGIHFGALSQPIGKQILGQGLKFNKKNISAFEKEMNAIHRLRFADLITDSIAKKAFGKLYKNIVKHVSTENGF